MKARELRDALFDMPPETEVVVVSVDGFHEGALLRVEYNRDKQHRPIVILDAE